jgi:hypothetical protein
MRRLHADRVYYGQMPTYDVSGGFKIWNGLFAIKANLLASLKLD